MLEILKRIGLSDGEILVYEALLNYGELGAGAIIEKTKLKRGDSYNKIYDLVQKGLVEEFTKNKKKCFRLEHPNKVQEYIERREVELEATRHEVAAILPSLVSTFNLAYHKPGVQYFEGEDAIAKITSDTLTAKGDIYSYVDIESVEKFYPKVNKLYRTERSKAKKLKHLIASDSSFNREYFKKNLDSHLDIRLVEFPLEHFDVNMQIYDDKVSFLSVLLDHSIGIIIEDKRIARVLRLIFDFNWSIAKPLV